MPTVTSTYTQAKKPIRITTPLGEDVLLLARFAASEGISQLFNYQIDLLAENGNKIRFEQLLGRPVSVVLEFPDDNERYFNGICNRIYQGGRDHLFTAYRMEVVPKFWLLTKQMRSRIFQHLTVPDILQQVLAGLDVAFELLGKYEPRDYCVQYRETDFNFANRLMEEEGIFYFFKHPTAGAHRLVLADTKESHPSVPVSPIVYKTATVGGEHVTDCIYEWSKVQELRSGKITLWDHSFELPHKHLEAQQPIQAMVKAGTVDHTLCNGHNDSLEIYDWPGKYAQRFDGVDAGGGDRPADLRRIFEDGERTVGLRAQAEAMPSVVVTGSSDCRAFIPGYKFNLAEHYDGDGEYLLLSVQHVVQNAPYRSSSSDMPFTYSNAFNGIPSGVPFRSVRGTGKPVIPGTQTAVVVGPKGQEIFTDKYGRVKVQFHWDRDGKGDANSSCWVRVAQQWAGKRWGASFWPRIGQEVVVAFEEGDPDRPVIVGSVYNADQMPPYLGLGPDGKHRNDHKLCGVKSNSTPGGVGFNEWRFDDTQGQEQVFIHAERNLDTRVINDRMELVLHDRHLIVGAEKDGNKVGDQRELVYKDKHLTTKGDHSERIEGGMMVVVGGGDGSNAGNQDIVIKNVKKELIEKDSHFHVRGNRSESVDGAQSLMVGGDQQEKVKNHALDAEMAVHLMAGTTVVIEAGTQLSLKVGGNFIDISPAGIAIQGTTVLINSGGAPGTGTGSTPASALDASEANPTRPAVADGAQTGYKSAPG